MQVRYLGPGDEVNVAPYGPQRKGAAKEYPKKFAEELLATSVKQRFEAVSAGEQKPESTPELEEQPKADPEAFRAEIPVSQRPEKPVKAARKKGRKKK